MDNELLIFLVDDDPMHTQMLKDHLTKFSRFKLKDFPTGEDAMAHISEKPDIMILDYNLNSVKREAKEGIDILIDLKEKYPNTDVIMLSGQDKIEIAVDTMKYGAYDYVIKNQSAFLRIEHTIFNILKKNRLERETRTYKTLAVVFAILFIVSLFGFILADQMGWLTKHPSAII